MAGKDAYGERSRALAQVAAAISIGATPETLRVLTDAALSAGASEEQVVGTLFAAAPVVGSARVMNAAPEIARAVGYDIDQALENLD